MIYCILGLLTVLLLPSQAYSFGISNAKPGEWVIMKANKGLYPAALTSVRTDEGTLFIFINNKVGSDSVWLSVLAPFSASYNEENAVTYVSGSLTYRTSDLSALMLPEGIHAASTTKSVSNIAIWTPLSKNPCSFDMKSFAKGVSHNVTLAINNRSLQFNLPTKNLANVMKKVLSSDCNSW
jgi:hypothetical protein